MSDEDRIARVARALCAADGQDPEAEMRWGRTWSTKMGGAATAEVTAPV